MLFLLGLLLPICFVPGITGASIPTQWALLSILLPVTLWREARFTFLHLLGLVFCAWACLTALWGHSFYTSVLGLWYVALWALSFRLGSTRLSLYPIWLGLAIGLTINTPFALAQAFGYHPVEVGGGQIAGLLYSSTVLGSVSALVLIASWAHSIWLFMPFLVANIALSGNRGAWLIIILTVIAKYIHWTVALTILALGAIAFTYLPLDNSNIQRLHLWGYALAGLNLFGWGPDAFNDVFYLAQHTGKGPTVFHAEFVHNDYLQLLFEFGIGAVIPFAIIGIVLSRTQSIEWPITFACAILASFYFPLYSPITAFIFCLTTGHLAARWSMDGALRHLCRFDFISWNTKFQRSDDSTRGKVIPLVSRTSQSEA